MRAILAEKRELLATRREFVFRALPEASAASVELLRWQVYGLVALLVLLSNVPLACLVVLAASPGLVALFPVPAWPTTMPRSRPSVICASACTGSACISASSDFT